MIDEVVECMLNPVKCKLMMEIAGKGKATAKELMQSCDIPQATLYRSLNRMVQLGILEVVERRRVRGVEEKLYALCENMGEEGNRLLQEKGAEGLLILFTQFTAGLLREFQEYAKNPDADFINDSVGFSVCPVCCTKEEMQAVSQKIGEALLPLANNPPGEGRRMHTIATIITPPKN